MFYKHTIASTKHLQVDKIENQTNKCNMTLHVLNILSLFLHRPFSAESSQVLLTRMPYLFRCQISDDS